MLRKNINVGLIHSNTAALYDQLPRNVYKCIFPMTNDL